MASQPVIHDIVFLHVFKEDGPDISNISLFPVGETVENGRRVMEGPDQFQLRRVELLRGLQQNIPRDAFIPQSGSHPFGYVLAPAV
jgi:hypothetical protein